MRPYYEHAGITIYHSDWREAIEEVSGRVGIVVTDPPYGTGGRRRNGTAQGDNPSGRVVREAWDDGDLSWIDGRWPVLAFYPPGRTLELLERARHVGLTKHRAVYLAKRDPSPQFGGRMSYSVEPVWALSREGFLLMGGTDWRADTTPRLGRDSDATGHPYQKPFDFVSWLLAKIPGTIDGEILEPFAGSGTTLLAAKSLGRKAIGIEIEERYCEIAAKRLAQEQLPLDTAGRESRQSNEVGQ